MRRAAPVALSGSSRNLTSPPLAPRGLLTVNSGTPPSEFRAAQREKI
jgi:hypothetical protein